MQTSVRRGVMAVAGGNGIGTERGCLPYVDDLNCMDIGNAVIEVWDVYDDPYRLDDAFGSGNGWTCDGVG